MTAYDESVRKRAETKVRRIIAREGTDNDVRLQPWYIEAIEEEIRIQDAACVYTQAGAFVGYNPKYGVSGRRITGVRYEPQGFNKSITRPEQTLPARMARR